MMSYVRVLLFMCVRVCGLMRVLRVSVSVSVFVFLRVCVCESVSLFICECV